LDVAETLWGILFTSGLTCTANTEELRLYQTIVAIRKIFLTIAFKFYKLPDAIPGVQGTRFAVSGNDGTINKDMGCPAQGDIPNVAGAQQAFRVFCNTYLFFRSDRPDVGMGRYRFMFGLDAAARAVDMEVWFRAANQQMLKNMFAAYHNDVIPADIKALFAYPDINVLYQAERV